MARWGVMVWAVQMAIIVERVVGVGGKAGLVAEEDGVARIVMMLRRAGMVGGMWGRLMRSRVVVL